MKLTAKEFTGMLMSGKGSLPRGQSKDERKRYEDGWLRVFGEKSRKRSDAKKKKRKKT